ncbi:MAG: SDR family NAD(P)-dependent oxidoreductase [Methylacidiphilales bacterium]|nr:SDR family NAD(P)-dependent oxidoreductase [Candidatus Methylacidiphilales bacterium]
MNYQLENKLALVSGSTAGIGLAIATSLAAEGAEVIVNGRTDDRVAEAIERIHQQHPHAKLQAFAGDLSKAEQVREIDERFQRIDILVNNLGVYQPKTFEKLADQEWYDIIETNFFSGLRLSRAFLPGMLGRNWGRIIFISSESGVQIPVEMIHYGVTKTMQLALARGLAETTIGTGVTVNSVLPGPTRSEGVEGFVKNMAKQQGKSTAEVEKEFFRTVRPSSLLQRFATNEEVANLVTYVASPLSSATNGAALRVDGGVVRSIL